MLFQDCNGESPLVFLSDRRTVYDTRLGGNAVMRGFSLGIKALGRENWLRTTRIAAYNPERETSAAGRMAKRDEIRTILARLKPRVCVVMASRKKERKQKFRGSEDDDGADESIKGTMCWEALHPPASIEQMCGTFWGYQLRDNCPDTTLVVGLQNPFNMEHIYNWQIANHLQRAWRVATGREVLLHHNEGTQFLPWRALAVDIESIPSTDKITLIGVSDGNIVRSFPWDAYRIHGTDTYTGYATDTERANVRDLLASPVPKIFHNAEYDVPFLRSKGITVNGEIIDTMLLHGVVYKQFRHGLQACVAQEFAVPPWKTMFGHGRDRSPDPQVWAMRQHELRVYNEQDTFFTWHLARALAPKAGVHVEGLDDRTIY